MPTTYDLTSLKALVLAQANKTKGLSTPWGSGDVDQAYDEAVRECGFEIPASTDADAQVKYQWLIQRMRYWFAYQLWQQYLLRFDTTDLRAGQIARNLEKIVAQMNEDFQAAKESDQTAHLFVDAGDVFGVDMVVTSGFLDNNVGEDIGRLGQSDSTRRPKQPTATQDVIDGNV